MFLFSMLMILLDPANMRCFPVYRFRQNYIHIAINWGHCNPVFFRASETSRLSKQYELFSPGEIATWGYTVRSWNLLEHKTAKHLTWRVSIAWEWPWIMNFFKINWADKSMVQSCSKEHSVTFFSTNLVWNCWSWDGNSWCRFVYKL